MTDYTDPGDQGKSREPDFVDPDQLGMFAPRARRTDPETSHAAADSISSDQLRENQRAVARCLREHGPGTDTEWMGHYQLHHEERGWPMQSTSGLRTRRKELVGRGLVIDTGDTKKLKSGRQSIVWEAV